MDQWTTALRCPDCAQVGVVSLSTDKRSDSKADHLPEGSKSVIAEYGETFYRATRYRPTKTVKI
jgi:hypothetical protein